MPHAWERIDAVRQHRTRSINAETHRFADRPLRFHIEVFPTERYLLVPEVSSEGRSYIPMGFMPSEVLCSNIAMLIPGATLYHFGILTPSLPMAWMRTVCAGSKCGTDTLSKSSTKASPDLILRTLSGGPSSKRRKGVLDTREHFATVSYHILYNQNAMPDELCHQIYHERNNFPFLFIKPIFHHFLLFRNYISIWKNWNSLLSKAFINSCKKVPLDQTIVTLI